MLLSSRTHQLELTWRTINMAGMIDSPLSASCAGSFVFYRQKGTAQQNFIAESAEFMSNDVVPEWYRKFKDRRTHGRDEGGQRHKTVACEDLVQRVDQVVGERETKVIFTFSESRRQFWEDSFSTNGEPQEAKETYHNALLLFKLL
ncbi:hypothetical protein AVEN_115109-1 [Araneus ventricosus]|uniref:Mos1 transposase HTH domain-containing protein n=1 Tax=Araneus ventricosus TaxID=182803 RepID=A0A4Y1ZY97_ARAVE|nr:hypothetical protein AVEN_115109-1 [Araneus ventricosus]